MRVLLSRAPRPVSPKQSCDATYATARLRFWRLFFASQVRPRPWSARDSPRQASRSATSRRRRPQRPRRRPSPRPRPTAPKIASRLRDGRSFPRRTPPQPPPPNNRPRLLRACRARASGERTFPRAEHGAAPSGQVQMAPRPVARFVRARLHCPL